MNLFKPNIEEVGQLGPRTQEEIKNEPMLWSADLRFAYINGGPITREFLAYLDPDKDWIIDTRSHMLMEGWLPCIGGWHLDNMPRNTETGQPNYKNPPFICNHTLAVVDNGTGSLTEFLTTPVVLPDVPVGEKVYKVWNEQINALLNSEALCLKSEQIQSGKIITFDSKTFHRGVPATGSGFRFFIRAMTDTPQTAKNEIRRQVNTYIDFNAGW